MNCREFTEFLHEYLSGDLPPDVWAEFENHLAECPSCVAYLDGYQQTIAWRSRRLPIPRTGHSPSTCPRN